MLALENKRYRWLVYTDSEEVLGYAYIGPFRLRAAYNHTVETAIYLKHGAARKGIGSELYEALLKWTAQNNFKTAIAG